MRALLLLLASFPAHADNLACRAEFDAGARYDLRADMAGSAIAGDVEFQYHDEDNDKSASLKPSAQSFARGSSLHFTAGNENMETRVDADHDSSTGFYEGALHVKFHVENVPPVDLPVTCTWK